ncbi:MAG TPA: hypothetical protein VNO18_04015 [Xanthobacteraceae bacterium]|nr:hypothetical protein [Xanthobacteraceae bacterium]
MHGNIQGLRDGVDCNREALATVNRQLRSIYGADISLPSHFARLLNELGSFRSVGMQAIGQHATPVLTG